MDFRNFFISYVFKVKETNSRKFHKATICSDYLKNPGQLPVLQVLEGSNDWVSWIFVISSISYVFKIKKTISRKFTKLPCSGDLENPGQLPVLQVLEGTDDWVFMYFT